MNKYLTWFRDLKKQYGIEDNDPIANELEKFLIAQDSENNRPLLTEAGIKILEFLQSCGRENLKAKDIAEGMDLPSRKVSGAMRKLNTDKFVDKFGTNPVIYSLTEKGKTFNINAYKESLNNEKEDE